MTTVTNAALRKLAESWPLQARVEHAESGWTGVVASDPSIDAPVTVADTDNARGVVGTVHAVCVQWAPQQLDRDGNPVTVPAHDRIAWVNVMHLRRQNAKDTRSKAAPRARVRRRK